MTEERPFTIALPAGRLAEESINFFKDASIAEFDSIPSKRILSLWDKEKKIRVLLVRSQDVPTYVIQGGADAGITGRDILWEGAYDLTVPFEFPFGKCRLSIATLPEQAEHLFQKTCLRVATKYPRIATDYFYKKGLNCEIMKLHGSIEIAPVLSLVDCIVDLVSTGMTLKDNGLVEVSSIAEFSAVLVANRSTYALQTSILTELFGKIKKYLS